MGRGGCVTVELSPQTFLWTRSQINKHTYIVPCTLANSPPNCRAQIPFVVCLDWIRPMKWNNLPNKWFYNVLQLIQLIKFYPIFGALFQINPLRTPTHMLARIPHAIWIFRNANTCSGDKQMAQILLWSSGALEGINYGITGVEYNSKRIMTF